MSWAPVFTNAWQEKSRSESLIRLRHKNDSHFINVISSEIIKVTGWNGLNAEGITKFCPQGYPSAVIWLPPFKGAGPWVTLLTRHWKVCFRDLSVAPYMNCGYKVHSAQASEEESLDSSLWGLQSLGGKSFASESSFMMVIVWSSEGSQCEFFTSYLGLLGFALS